MEISNERRMLLAIVLAVGVLMLWQFIFPPPKRALVPPPDGAVAESAEGFGESGGGERDPLAGRERDPLGDPDRPATLAAGEDELRPGEDIFPSAPAVTEEQARTITLERGRSLVMVTNRGARVVSWKLTTFKDDEGRNLELVPDLARSIDRLPLEILTGDPDFDAAANKALYRMERVGEDRVRFTWSDGRGREVTKSLRVGDEFQGRVRVEARDRGRSLPVSVGWGASFGVPPGPADAARFMFSGRALIQQDPKPTRLQPSSVEGIQSYRGRLWAGLEDTYFTALFLPEDGGRFTILPVDTARDADEEGEPALVVAAALDPEDPGMQIYVGPKDYQLLDGMGRELQEVVHFQSGIPLIGGLVTFLTRGLFQALIFLHENVVANWGWSIVLLTMFIKVLFWPITQKATISMKKMQEKTRKVQPKVQAIRERYRKLGKKDIQSRQKMNQEVMELYQKAGINPASNLGGCLPLFLQLPILYGFYNLLQVTIELRQAPWILWVHDLSRADPYYVLPIVMGASMVVQQLLTGAAIPDPMQRRMMYMTPVLFTFFFLNMPSGLVLYWLVNNLLGILQLHLIDRKMKKQKLAPQPAARSTPRRA